jgi:hypothetical protein
MCTCLRNFQPIWGIRTCQYNGTPPPFPPLRGHPKMFKINPLYTPRITTSIDSETFPERPTRNAEKKQPLKTGGILSGVNFTAHQ